MMNNIKNSVPNQFLNPEIRNDFYVDKKKKKIWAIEIDLLSELMRVCKLLSIKCFVDSGTALGAIRHSGFIPWDDDIDVGLTYRDYIILIKKGPKIFKHPYFLQTSFTDKAISFPFARLRNSSTTGIVTSLLGHKYNQGIYIDIHLWCKYVPNDKSIDKYLLLRDRINYLIYIKKNGFAKKKRSIGKTIAILATSLLALFIPSTLLNHMLLLILRKDNKNIKNDDLMMMMTIYPSFSNYCFHYYGIKNLIYVKFEYITVPVPSDYIFHLEKAYGHWETFPPISERGKWHDGQIIFDPDIDYISYMKNNKKEFAETLKYYKD